jgi:hypothetical protein
MSKSQFLKNWRGSALAPGAQNQWGRAEGSSLSEREKKALRSGHIVTHDKLTLLKKLFVMDEQDNLWSIIIKTDDLKMLVSNLCDVGFESIA